MKCIIGLGNIGKEYDNTRHNIGFMSLDNLCNKYNVKIDKKLKKCIYGEKEINGEKIVFVKPTTFMNLSGEARANAVEVLGLGEYAKVSNTEYAFTVKNAEGNDTVVVVKLTVPKAQLPIDEMVSAYEAERADVETRKAEREAERAAKKAAKATKATKTEKVEDVEF